MWWAPLASAFTHDRVSEAQCSGSGSDNLMAHDHSPEFAQFMAKNNILNDILVKQIRNNRQMFKLNYFMAYYQWISTAKSFWVESQF